MSASLAVRNPEIPIMDPRPAEQAWLHTCAVHEMSRHAAPGVPGDPLARLTSLAVDRCVMDGRLTSAQFRVLAEYGDVGRLAHLSVALWMVWDGALDILEAEMNKCGILPLKPFDCRLMAPLRGERETPFVDAANAWWWTLNCLEARISGARDNESLRVGRPCEPDDVVVAMDRLNLPPVHARTVMAWGKRGTEPETGSDARRLWDEVMDRLGTALRAKGIVRALAPTAGELIDLPLARGGALAAAARRSTAPVPTSPVNDASRFDVA
jgi:hypothetical protein